MTLLRFDALGDKLGIAYAHWSLGELASRQGDVRRAADLLGEALQTRQDMGDRRGVIECLEGVGVLALRTRSDLEGVRLLGYAYEQRESMASPVPPSIRAEQDQELARARERHGEVAVDRVLRDTAIETTEQALSVAHELITYAQGFAATGVRSGLDEE